MCSSDLSFKHSREVVHFHLKTHPTQEKDETRFLGREIHPYQSDPFPPIFCYICLSDRQDEPPQLTTSWQSPFTIRLHGKPSKAVKTYKSLCSWVAVHIPFNHQARFNPPRCFIKVVNFQSLRNYPQPK